MGDLAPRDFQDGYAGVEVIVPFLRVGMREVDRCSEVVELLFVFLGMTLDLLIDVRDPFGDLFDIAAQAFDLNGDMANLAFDSRELFARLTPRFVDPERQIIQAVLDQVDQLFLSHEMILPRRLAMRRGLP